MLFLYNLSWLELRRHRAAWLYVNIATGSVRFLSSLVDFWRANSSVYRMECWGASFNLNPCFLEGMYMLVLPLFVHLLEVSHPWRLECGFWTVRQSDSWKLVRDWLHFFWGLSPVVGWGLCLRDQSRVEELACRNVEVFLFQRYVFQRAYYAILSSARGTYTVSLSSLWSSISYLYCAVLRLDV